MRVNPYPIPVRLPTAKVAKHMSLRPWLDSQTVKNVTQEIERAASEGHFKTEFSFLQHPVVTLLEVYGYKVDCKTIKGAPGEGCYDVTVSWVDER